VLRYLIINGVPAATARANALALHSLRHWGARLIANTHAAEVRDDFNRPEAERLSRSCIFQGLEIRKATEHGDAAQVDFVLRFKRDGKDMIQVELADFLRENGRWLYAGANSVLR
jgi:SEC-C motif-containing protein